MGERVEAKALARSVTNEFNVKLNKRVPPEVVGVIHPSRHVDRRSAAVRTVYLFSV
jgi:hypothetical protein